MPYIAHVAILNFAEIHTPGNVSILSRHNRAQTTPPGFLRKLIVKISELRISIEKAHTFDQMVFEIAFKYFHKQDIFLLGSCSYREADET